MDKHSPFLDQAATDVKTQALDFITRRSAKSFRVSPYDWTDIAFQDGSLSVDPRQVGRLLGEGIPAPRANFKILPVRSAPNQRRFASNGGGRLRIGTKSSFLGDIPGVDDKAFGIGVEFAVMEAMGEALRGSEAMQFLACLFMQVRLEVAAYAEILSECKGPGVLMLIVKTGPMAPHHDAFMNALLGMMGDHEIASRRAEANGLPASPPLLAVLNRQPLAITRHPGLPGYMPLVGDLRDMMAPSVLH